MNLPSKAYRFLFILLAAFWLFAAAAAQAGDLIFQYRAADDEYYTITSVEDIERYVFDTDCEAILTEYFGDSADIETIRARVSELSYDITVTVDGRHPTAQEIEDAESWEYWSWSSGSEINLWHEDRYRAMSTLAHETAHSYMNDLYGSNPTYGMSQGEKYGLDEQHYVEEITNPQTAWSEGYAEYWGDRAGSSQQSIGSVARTLYTESTTMAGIYSEAAWSSITDADDMWSSELVNSAILRDITEHIPGGADKIEELMRTGGYCETLRDFVQVWSAAYPDDGLRLALIIDANTGFTMDDADFEALLGQNGVTYAGNYRPGYRQQYAGRDPLSFIDGILMTGQRRTVQSWLSLLDSVEWIPGVPGVIARLHSQLAGFDQILRPDGYVAGTRTLPDSKPVGSVSAEPGHPDAVPSPELPGRPEEMPKWPEEMPKWPSLK
jgi:hypothetical protein